MSSSDAHRARHGAVPTVCGLAALGAILVGAAVGAPGVVIGALAGALVGWLAWC